MKFSMKSGPPYPSSRSNQYSGPNSTGTAVGLEIVGEGAVGAQRLFQFVHREAGIGGQERARRVDGFEHHFAAAAAAHAEAEDAQQFAGLRRHRNFRS